MLLKGIIIRNKNSISTTINMQYHHRSMIVLRNNSVYFNNYRRCKCITKIYEVMKSLCTMIQVS